MAKWEYKIEVIQIEPDPLSSSENKQREELLNKLGRAGWELFTWEKFDQCPIFCAVFRRPLPEV